jgi:hypothetical protein
MSSIAANGEGSNSIDGFDTCLDFSGSRNLAL